MIAPPTPVTGAGNECAVVVPSPSSPTSLPPQHCTDPSSEPRAAVAPAGRDRARRRQRKHAHRRPAVQRGPVAELAGVVLAPAARAAVIQQRAAVVAAHRDPVDRRQARDLPRRQPVGDHPVAHLTADVPPPAEDGAAARERAGVVAARGHGADAAEAGDARRRRRVGLAAEAELPVGIRPPARRRCRHVARRRCARRPPPAGPSSGDVGDEPPQPNSTSGTTEQPGQRLTPAPSSRRAMAGFACQSPSREGLGTL